MSSILKVRLPDGRVVDIPALKGLKGDTPVKGVDYWTEDDKAEIQEYVDDAVGGAKAPSKTVSLNEVVPSGSMPSICDFEFKPTTPFCAYELSNKNILSQGKFFGREVPLLTTKGSLKVISNNGSVKFEKYINPMINISRDGWNVSDTLTQNGLHKVWSKKFYMTMDEYVSKTDIPAYSNGQTNSIYVFEFDESDFAETGIPAKLDNIPVASPCFYTGNNSQAYIDDRVWGGQPFPLKFSYNKDTGKYTMTIRGLYTDTIFYQLSHYSKTYIYYQLETPYDEKNFLAMSLEEGDIISFENDYSDIQEYLDTSGFFQGNAYGGNVTNSDITPTISAVVPQNTQDALNGFNNAARIFNEGQSSIEDDVAQDYSWIGNGDGTTDYTTIIQNKIKELSSLSNGGTIFLGNGVYNISNFIELYDNIKLIGTGNTVIQQTNKTSHVVIVSGSNIEIKDLKLKLYAMSAEEKDGLQYSPELTACIYINSNNSKSSELYNDNYLDNMYCKNLTIDNVYLAGSYGFKYINGKPAISNDYEHYRGCGLIAERLFFNYATLTNVHISGMFHGLHGVGGSNDITIFCENSKIMAYGNGGYANLSIYGHSYYDTDESGNTISMSDEIGHFTNIEQSYIAEYVYDIQWMKHAYTFEGYTMNNRYVVSQIGGASYVGNGEEQSVKLTSYVVDYGRGNRAVENFQNTPYHIGSKFIGKTGQTSFKNNDVITQNALSGAGVWGNITSNDTFDQGDLSLSEICRYPSETDINRHKDHTTFLSAISNNIPTEENPIEILIDITDRPIYALRGCFIQFAASYIASDFNISFATSNANNFDYSINVTDNTDVVWCYMSHQKSFRPIYKIKITITKALHLESLEYQNSNYVKYDIEYNPEKKIGICNIGMIDADFTGRTFLGECGGNVYGDLLLHKNSTIKNIPIPVDEGDAVSKKYVDKTIANNAEVLIVNVHIDENNTITKDKTYAEVKAAIDSGKIVKVRTRTGSPNMIELLFVCVRATDEGIPLEFYHITGNEYCRVLWFADESITFYSNYYLVSDDIASLEADIGDIETALDSIIAIQNELMGVNE